MSVSGWVSQSPAYLVTSSDLEHALLMCRDDLTHHLSPHKFLLPHLGALRGPEGLP